MRRSGKTNTPRIPQVSASRAQVLVEARADRRPQSRAPGGDLLKARPAINPVHMLLTYPYPVHRISPRF
ncbi:MAG TPA: hypothetical protein VLD83_17710, partial [Candidatus Binatia bacterium]|nr:hypothetical protein [Candidatus Binatia bacterium]